MQAHRVVKAFEVFENGRPGLRLIVKLGAVHALTFGLVKERFHRGIVVTVRCATHAHFNAQFCQECPIAQARVLTASVRMCSKPACGWRRTRAICKAKVTNCSFSQESIAQPTTIRENTSRTTARSSHPPAAGLPVRSGTHLVL